jgi:type I restriction enzyme R subunit
MTKTESLIEQDFITKLGALKYTYRPDIRDRTKPNVFTAVQTLRTRNSFIREDGTPRDFGLECV